MASTRVTTTAVMSPSRHSLQETDHLLLRNPSVRLEKIAANFSIKTSSSRRFLVKALSAAADNGGLGLQASITDPKDNALTVKNAEIVTESRDADKVRVDLTGEDTRIVFDKVLTNLARTAPPVPGFRKQKGGKTSKVPKEFLLQMLGETRVTNFVIQEIVSSTLADYVNKEDLSVKDNKVNTVQTADELRVLFSPGDAFGFNAVIELESTAAAAAEVTSS